MPDRSEAAEYWEGFAALPTNAGTTLPVGTNYNYKVNATSGQTVTINGTAAQRNGLNISAGNAVTIYIPAGVTLSVNGYGVTGSDATGGGAGISLPNGATLYLRGAGFLEATGGVGGAGTRGADSIKPDGDVSGGNWGGVQVGNGGNGGAGGGGAGAGIGSAGGTGGAGEAGGSVARYVYGNDTYPTQVGANGATTTGAKGGNSGAVGDLYILDTVTVTANAGVRGATTAVGGAIANSDPRGGGYTTTVFGQWSQSTRDPGDGGWYAIASGGGGGAGGAGGRAATIGSGGAGGGGGGGGGAGGAFWINGSYANRRDDPTFYATGSGGTGGTVGWDDSIFGNSGAGTWQGTGISGGYGSNGGGRGVPNTDGGAVFVGTDATLNGNSGIPVANDATAAQRSNFTTYNLTYTANGTNVSGMPASPQKTYAASVPNQYISSFTRDQIKRTGYTFDNRWNTNAGGTGTNYLPGASIDFAANRELFAIWIPNDYPITLDRNGGSPGTGTGTIYQRYGTGWYMGTNASQPIAIGSATGTTIGMPTRVGYTYNGHWSTNATSGGTQYLSNAGKVFATSTPTTDFSNTTNTIYARWTANTYTIRFFRNWNGDTIQDPSAQTATYDETGKVYPATSSRTGYTFEGWNTDKLALSGSAAGSSRGNLSNGNPSTVDLYATWNVVNYDITYNVGTSSGHAVNAPTPAKGSYTIAQGNTTLAAAPVPNPAGADKNLIFSGWKVTAQAQGGTGFGLNATYLSRAVVPLASSYGNVTLTAQWIIPVGTEARSEQLLIPANTFTQAKTYWYAAVNTFIDGALADMNRVDLYEGSTYRMSLAGNGGAYTYTAVSADVSGHTYDVWANGSDTGVGLTFDVNPQTANVYYYTAKVTTQLNDTPADAASLVLSRGGIRIPLVAQDEPGVYTTMRQVRTQDGGEIDGGDDAWEIWVDGEDSGQTVSFVKDGNKTTVERYTLRFVVRLDDLPADSLGAFSLESSDAGKPDIIPTEKSAGAYEWVGFMDASTSYTAIVGGTDTGEKVAFTAAARTGDVDFYTLEARTYVDDVLSDQDSVTARNTEGGDPLSLARKSVGLYELVGQKNKGTVYELSVNGEDVGRTLQFTSAGRTADVRYYTVNYSGTNDADEEGEPPTDSLPHLSGSDFTLMPQHTLVRLAYTFNGWQEVGGGPDIYKPGATIAAITTRMAFVAVWADDANAEVRWVVSGSPTVHYGLLAEALAAAEGTDDGVDITLRKSCTMGAFTAALDSEDSLTTGTYTLTIASGGALTSAGLIDNSAGKVVVEGHGFLYNDDEVVSADAAHLEEKAGGFAASRVTFNVNGQGTTSAAVYVKFGEAAPTTTPSGQQVGYSFDGWYREAGCQNRWETGTGGTPVMNAVTIYASWLMNSYDVTFYGEDKGEDPQERTFQVKHGDTLVSIAPNLTEEGWTMKWWDRDTGGGVLVEDYDLTTPVTTDLDLRAHWVINEYWAKFNLNGHDDAEPAPPDVRIEFGGYITEPATPPAVAGWDLTGWFTDAGCDPVTRWDFRENTMPSHDVELFAGWRESAPIKVNFDLNGHSGTTPASVTAMPGDKLDFPVPVPVSDSPSYRFSAWCRDPDGYDPWNFSNDKAPPHDMTLYAGWSFVGYTITFDLNGLSEDAVTPVPVEQNTWPGERIYEPAPPTTSGYAFGGGWYFDKACTPGNTWDFANTLVTKSAVLYAKWDIESYSVTFDMNGKSGTPPSPSSETVTFGALVPQPTDPAATGYVFTGWYRDDNATQKWGFPSDRMPAKTLTLYAGWRADNAVRVSFNMNGHGDAPADQWVELGGTVDEPLLVPVVEGYDFGGWYADKPCTTLWVFGGGGTTVTADTAIYAKWTAKPPHTARFDLNGHGGDTPPSDQNAHYGELLNEPAPAPSEAGYTFLGWYKDREAKGKWVFVNDTMPDDDLTLYAGWRDNSSFKVLFDPNLPVGAKLSGTPPPSVWVLPGAHAPEPGPAPAAAGYTFGGWYRDAACSPGGLWDFAGMSVNGTLTLYAKWTPAPCTVYFNTDNKSAAIASVTAYLGDKLKAPATPSALGFEFKGWYTSNDDGSQGPFWDFGTDTVPAADTLVLTALWAPAGSYEVSFDLNTSPGGFVGDPSGLVPPAVQWLVPGDWADEPVVAAEGQDIEGWYTTDAAFTPATLWDFTNGTVGNSDMKLYAKWAPRVYELSYELNGHATAAMPGGAVTYGALLTRVTPPAMSGWEFTAWYGDMPLHTRWDFATETMPAHNVTLYAGWHSSSAFKVEFDMDGHGVTPAAVWVEPGAPWLDEPAPRASDEGYTFDGWYTDGGAKWDFMANTVVGDMTLHAGWTLNEYYISFDTGGFGGHSPATVKAGFGTRIAAPPPPTQYGYVFGGWYTDELCKSGLWDFGVDTVPSTDMTLYAKWTKGRFTASFGMNGHGGAAPPPQTVAFDDKVIEPAQPSETGWVFGGWYRDAACSAGAEWDFATDTMRGEDMTLYAKWTIDANMVFFVMNGHGGQAPNPVRVEYGARIPMPAQPYAEGWAFGGWYTDMACSPGYEWNFNTGAMPANDMTLFAKWTADSSGGGNSGGNKDKDKDKDKDSGKDKNSGKDNDKSKDNAGNKGSDAEGGSGGSGNGGSGSNSNAEGGGESTTDEAIDGIAGDDDTYGEAGADNASGEDSEWNTNGGSAEAGDDGRGSGGDEDMSFANILLMVVGIVIAIFIAINARRRRYERWLPPVVIALGALGAVLYFVIEDIHGAWALINSHTIYFALILAAQIAATMIARRSKVDSGTSPE
jgi:uncharacterized repeat protein (TIGR02543 family)